MPLDTVSQLQEELLKALASSSGAGTDASPLIKEDLEMEAHTQLYMESDPGELTILKHIPRKMATSVIHQFTQVIGYGSRSHDGFYGENTLPAEATMQTRRKSVDVKLMGDISSVFALASFQSPISALGSDNLVGENQASARLDLLLKMAREIYAANTRTTSHTLRYAGLKQQILEGTSVSTSAPFTVNTDYIIDLRGRKLLPEEIRKRAVQIRKKFGMLRWIYMSPDTQSFLEQTLDPAERLNIPRQPGEEVLLGQNISGMHTGGVVVRFAMDNTLTAELYRGSPPTTAVTGAPVPPPTIGAPSAATNASSLWETLDADGAVLYDITALNESGESTSTQVGPVAVAAGESVTIAITPRAADTSYKVYRSDSVHVTPMFIAEILGPGNTTPFNFVDHNATIPGTTEAFGMNIASANNSIPVLQSLRQNDFRMVSMSNPERPRNTCSLAQLGPWMGMYDLARILHTASRDLLFSAFTPEVTHPFQNVIWVNCGDRD
jgi:hypothetical protein